MKTLARYGLFALIIGGIISLLVVIAINRKIPNGLPAESNSSASAKNEVGAHIELPTNNIRTNRTVTFTISPKFGGFKKQQ